MRNDVADDIGVADDIEVEPPVPINPRLPDILGFIVLLGIEGGMAKILLQRTEVTEVLVGDNEFDDEYATTEERFAVLTDRSRWRQSCRAEDEGRPDATALS